MATQPTAATPIELARLLQRMKAQSARSSPPATLLLGSGFSRSARILTGAEIVEQKLRPLLPGAPPTPLGRSDYAHLMSLLQPRERAGVIKECIEQAKDAASGALVINWAHLLLASMVAARYVNLVLTTNFDPLIVDALAITGLPIRAYDLTAGGAYLAGTLDAGSVIYLHGQSHAPFLANVDAETERVRQHLPVVFADAMRDSTLIVVGYSGDCDPVLQELCKHYPQFPYGCYWVHRNASKPLGPQASILLGDGIRNARLISGFDADRFMNELVIKGLELDLPRMILDPLGSMDHALARVAPLPPEDGAPATNPVNDAREYVRRADRLAKEPTQPAPGAKPSNKPRVKPRGSQRSGAKEGYFNVTTSESAPLEMRVSMAALVGDATELEKLRPLVLEAKDQAFQRKLGDGFLRAASRAVGSNHPEDAPALLERAEELGVSETHWLNNVWGAALDAQARKKEGAEADRLWEATYAKYAQAIRIKPDMHEVFYNWGNALDEQARRKEGAEADRLWDATYAKYAEAVRIKPDMHEAFYNWGVALDEQARKKRGAEADRLWEAAFAKYAAAIWNKPDKHEAFSNWANALAEQARKKEGAEADRLWQEAYSKYAEAIRIKPDNHDAFNNWGVALAQQARQNEGAEADRLWEAVYAKYAEAIRIKPDNHDAFNNWGVALAEQAGKKEGAESDRLWQEAYSKYAEAIRIKPDNHDAFNNWGVALAQQARQNEGAEADRLWEAVYAKYAEAIRIKPDNHDAFNNWGVALAEQAGKKEGAESDRLSEAAYAKYSEAVRIKPNHPSAYFNLACLAAILGSPASAVSHLRTWLVHFDGNPLKQIAEDRDFDPIRETPEFKSFLAELTPAKAVK